jgi:hypothetical protein
MISTKILIQNENENIVSTSVVLDKIPAVIGGIRIPQGIRLRPGRSGYRSAGL